MMGDLKEFLNGSVICCEENIHSVDDAVKFLQNCAGNCVFFIPQEYGPNDPRLDTDYWQFVNRDGEEIFYGYCGMDYWMVKCGAMELSCDPADLNGPLAERCDEIERKICEMLDGATVYFVDHKFD